METTTEAIVVVLPDDVLATVLGCLPPRSLAASRCICRAWRGLVDDRRLLLPHAVRGLFLNYQDYKQPHFFARPPPTAAAAAGPWIDGKFDFIVAEKPYSWHEVVDHCNGLVLYWDRNMNILYVCNPTTRRWARLPPRSGDHWGRHAFLVFDPAMSPHYKVLLAPVEPSEYDGEEEKDACRSMEWPPSPWTWHEFSSRTGRWETKVFVREGEAAGRVGDLLLNPMEYCGVEPRWRYGAYWQGELYIHCHGEYVSRLSLLNDKYQVIKSPIDLAECKNNNVMSFLGRSEKGVYFAAIDDTDKLRVWILSESSDHQMGWVSKHQSTLKTNSWWLHEKKYDAPWILDIYTKRYKEIQQDVCWNSDDDDIFDVSDDEEDSYDGYITFLGFHPYKEVTFLCCGGYTAVAFHLNSSKVQYLGKIVLRGIYNRGQRESFVYTPCLIGD